MDVDWTAVANSGLWLLGLFILIGLFTNCFGLFDRTYKGQWIKVKHDSLLPLVKKLGIADGFKDSDGMQRHLECKLIEEYYDTGYVYYTLVKIPEYVFHTVAHDVILKELGIK